MATLSDPKSPSRVEALAHELEQMALRATARDHVESPIIHVIAAEPDPRPFEQALRTMVSTLSRDKAGAPEGSIVLRLIEDGDFDVAFKLDLLRTLVRANGVEWENLTRAGEPGFTEHSNALFATVQAVVAAGGAASVAPLLEWCNDQNGLRGGGSVFEVGQWLIIRLASDHPRPVLDAVGSHRCALPVLPNVAAQYPREAAVYIRDKVAEGNYGPAVFALAGLGRADGMTEEARELGTAIAGDVNAANARVFALAVLLRLPNVEPVVWRLLRELPASLRTIDIPDLLGSWVRRGSSEALELLEEWLDEPKAEPNCLDAICDALGVALSNVGGVCPLPVELQRHLVTCIKDALDRGARTYPAASAVELAIGSGKSVDYEGIGLERLVAPLLSSRTDNRVPLLYAAAWASVRATPWGADLFERLTTAVTPEERTKWIGILEGHAFVASSKTAVAAVRAAGRVAASS